MNIQEFCKHRWNEGGITSKIASQNTRYSMAVFLISWYLLLVAIHYLMDYILRRKSDHEFNWIFSAFLV